MSVAAKLAYRETFLDSEEWKDIRYAKLVRDGCACDVCGKEDFGNDAHHVHYPQRWKETTSGDLVVLCRKHHEMIHRYKRLCCKNLSTSWENYITAREEIRKQSTFAEVVPVWKPAWLKDQQQRYAAMRSRFFRVTKRESERHGLGLPGWLRRFLEGLETIPLAEYIQQRLDKAKLKN